MDLDPQEEVDDTYFGWFQSQLVCALQYIWCFLHSLLDEGLSDLKMESQTVNSKNSNRPTLQVI